MDEDLDALSRKDLVAEVKLLPNGILDVQERLQARISELDIDVHEEEFQYWRKYERHGKGRK